MNLSAQQQFRPVVGTLRLHRRFLVAPLPVVLALTLEFSY